MSSSYLVTFRDKQELSVTGFQLQSSIIAFSVLLVDLILLITVNKGSYKSVDKNLMTNAVVNFLKRKTFL